MDDSIKALNSKRQAWISAVNSGEIESYLSLLSENIIWFPPGQQLICGRDEFREWVKPFFRKIRV